MFVLPQGSSKIHGQLSAFPGGGVVTARTGFDRHAPRRIPGTGDQFSVNMPNTAAYPPLIMT
jgi:hypothetical protein